MPQSFELLSIGDAMLDIFLQLEEADVRCNVNHEDCVICFSYADKIPIESITKVPGAGNASNNAVGASRLGIKTLLYSVLGDDATGKMIEAYWKSEGVNTKLVTFDKNHPTNYSTVLNFHGERTILIYHEKRGYAFPTKIPKVQWVYLTSMGKGSERIHPQLIAYLDHTKAKLVFQPGTFQLRLGIRMLKHLIARCHVFILNKEEARDLLGNETKEIRELLTAFYDIGCAIPIITDGPNGSFAFDGKHMYQMGIFDVPIVERTGCGDAFATALMAALHYGKSLEDALRWGTANSTSVIGSIGPQEGLLNRRHLNAMLRRFKNVTPKKTNLC